MPLNNVLLFKDPNEALNFWYLMFTHVLDRHAPKTKKELNPGSDQNGLLLKFWKLLNLDNFIKRKRDWQGIKYKDS